MHRKYDLAFSHRIYIPQSDQWISKVACLDHICNTRSLKLKVKQLSLVVCFFDDVAFTGNPSCMQSTFFSVYVDFVKSLSLHAKSIL